MNHEQLMEAVRNLLSIGPVPRRDLCDQCNERVMANFGTVGGEPVCEDCIRTHASLVLQHAESLAESEA